MSRRRVTVREKAEKDAIIYQENLKKPKKEEWEYRVLPNGARICPCCHRIMKKAK